MINAIKLIEGNALPLRGDDIDTDRIIPARFLRCVTFDGLGESAFYDERFDTEDKPLDHPMNNNAYEGASIMVSGNNFGCGSSREHAPQAIKRAGYTAIVAESFAEIFYGNSSVLGLVCITLSKENIEKLTKTIENNPKITILIDIEKRTLQAGDDFYDITIKDTLRNSLLDGTYDTLGELMSNKEITAKVEQTSPPKYV